MCHNLCDRAKEHQSSGDEVFDVVKGVLGEILSQRHQVRTSCDQGAWAKLMCGGVCD